MKNNHIDHGKRFDWGRTSSDYAKYRDIYPDEFYQKILDKGLCVKSQKILDIGTGTGVLPRNLYRYGADFIGVDISENQILQAKALADAADMNIDFYCIPAEGLHFPDRIFDVVTACQCFSYFNHNVLAPKISHMLKKDGKFVVLYMVWLPFEDDIARKSEEMVLRFNPDWTGGGATRHTNIIPEIYNEYFVVESEEIFDLSVPFTRDSWNGRMKACRGIGASLSHEETERFHREHMALLEKIAPERFDVLHFAAITVLGLK